MSKEVAIIFGIVSMVLWILFSVELSKSSKESDNKKSRGKLVTLMFAGIISTLFLAFSLLKEIQF